MTSLSDSPELWRADRAAYSTENSEEPYKNRYEPATDPLHFLVHGLTVTGSLWFRLGLGFRTKAGCVGQFGQSGFYVPGLFSLPPTGREMLGRKMFRPIRGPWPDDKWKGWGYFIFSLL